MNPFGQRTITAVPDTALLVLDGSGRVELANPSACTLWQAKLGELVGDFFPNLFVFEVTSREPDWVQAEWEVLQSAALAHPAKLRLQPKEKAAFEVVVRLEQASTTPPRFFAYISRPPSPTSPPFPVSSDSPVNSLFATLAERSPLGFFDLNFVKNEVYYSPAWKRMLGYSDDGLPNIYDTWLALIHPDDSAAAPDKLLSRTATTAPRSFSIEYRLKHARGHYVWVQSVGLQLHSPNGALQRVIGAHIDIQDRKDFEESSLHTEERLLLMTERGRMAVFDLDFTGDRTWLSPAFKALLGYAETELPDTPESFLRALPAEETTGGLPAFFLTQQPGQVVYFDTLQMCHRSGSELWLYTGLVRIFSRKRELQRVLGFVAPMPKGAGASGAPASMPPEHLTTLLGELREAVLVADAQSRVLLLNPVAEELLGRSIGQAIGQPAAEVFRTIHRMSGAPGENPIDRALALNEPTFLNNEFALDLGNKKMRPITFSCSPVIDAAGHPNGAVLVFRDPNEMSLTPEEVLRSNRFDSLGQLAGGIAHDFNNFLTTVLGGVSLAKENRDYSGLENSERACLAAKALSKQLLAFAKGGTAVRQVVRPVELLGDAVRLAAAGSAVKIELKVPVDTGTICVDRAQLLQVFQNLIINAIQAMPAGQGNIWVDAGNVELVADQVSPLAPGQYVALQVRDNGSGIKPEHLEKIFDPFFTTKKTGTGLGLATVLSIAKRHGGQIGVESEIGTGTTFTVFLPRAEQDAEVEARRAPSFPAASRTGRVLFMDDDAEICHLTGAMLESLDYKFDLAKNGEEALQLYKRYLNIGRPYDVVIMDLTIVGGMGGEATYKHLRELDPDVRAIIASGYDNDDMARQFLDMGFCGYLTKPYRVGDLGRIIKKVLGS